LANKLREKDYIYIPITTTPTNYIFTPTSNLDRTTYNSGVYLVSQIDLEKTFASGGVNIA